MTGMIGDTDRFVAQFGYQPAVVADAGGRVNLIGEHTDYHGGLVLPMAIDLRTRVVGAARSDRAVRIFSEAQNAQVEASLKALPPGRSDWTAHALAPYWALLESGHEARGADLLVRSSVPVGAGLSSSAALMVSLVAAAATLSELQLSQASIAYLAQKAENGYCRIPCGAMDQLACACGVPGHALLIDCRSGAQEAIAIPPAWALVIVDSGVRHSVAASAYVDRQRECEEGMAILRKETPTLATARDLTMDQLLDARGALSVVAFRRLRHVVTENTRVLHAKDAISRCDAAGMGELMVASHESLVRDYEASCGELDRLVEIAMSLPGVFGARLTGAGWGGNTVNLAEASEARHVAQEIVRQFGLSEGRRVSARVVEPSRGVRVTAL